MPSALKSPISAGRGVKKSVAEYGDKVGADEKAKIEAAVKDAEELLKQPDASKDAMEAKSESLAKAAQKLGETMYADAQAAAGAAGGGAGAQGAGDSAGPKDGEEKVVDAEFTEVKDRK